MIIKRYIASNMGEALNRIKYELGKDAIIISQRRVRRKGGLFGLFSKKGVEVTAAINSDNSTSSKRDSNINVQNSINAIRRVINNTVEGSKPSTEVSKPSRNKVIDKVDSKNDDGLIKEMHEMRGMLDEMMHISLKGTKSELQINLENIDIDENIAEDIVNSVNSIKDDRTEQEKLKDIVKSSIKVADNVLQDVVILVGPTGVGKTTTIAKLSGRLALIEKKKVGLLTIDTYRIGAVEQLKTYADIMNIPFKVVFTIKEMEAAVKSMEDCDVILIDTTGRSSKNVMQISELRAFMEKVNVNSVHLVISCTTKNRDIDIIANGYRCLNYNNVIITKLDETSTYGSILNICNKTGKPISFVTTGQNVPDDIRLMSSKELASLVLGEDTL
ncbi:flagellar biosynthesis protein FlhF [Clostridium sp. JN-1]|uniref:flagellar biosynthesis protein FlhF n=1 Tax=Clostridium sp. JN-1 TaxID=2483110 RepID=UPI000F0B4D80|nr:flagellar biosynthesis protein FlhF [Clostridium sp. JN-1]